MGSLIWIKVERVKKWLLIIKEEVIERDISEDIEDDSDVYSEDDSDVYSEDDIEWVELS